jgi:putative RNA 2'-phosphotransferase
MLDKEGWTSVDGLLIALPLHHNNRWGRHVKRQDLEEMIARSDKLRFELKHDKIRALYGHSYSSSLFTKIHKIASKPPAILYHGTSSSAAKNIMLEGLRPMNRQYVHLSTDGNTAIQVAKRKTILKKEEEPVIIAISAVEAYNTGVYYFYQAIDSIWLTDYIHPDFMRLLK